MYIEMQGGFFGDGQVTTARSGEYDMKVIANES